MSKPTFYTFDAATNSFHDADGNILVTLPAPDPAPNNDLTQVIAKAFGYSAEAMPDILRVGAGDTSDENAPSQAHLDIARSFTVESERCV